MFKFLFKMLFVFILTCGYMPLEIVWMIEDGKILLGKSSLVSVVFYLSLLFFSLSIPLFEYGIRGAKKMAILAALASFFLSMAPFGVFQIMTVKFDFDCVLVDSEVDSFKAKYKKVVFRESNGKSYIRLIKGS